METQVFDEGLLQVPSKDLYLQHATTPEHSSFSFSNLARQRFFCTGRMTIHNLWLFTRNVSPYFDTHSPIEGADVTRGSLQKDVSNCEGLVLASF
ncbi:hypothetical protein N7455_005784 [Penicillium solitum]|uniref:uncharacterized protein n=1 Tax=Penicillium solitum TaxID=60172 RepID=UPI0032C47EC3|nr:hypothetical protein N7536_000431 [Penicillium majusculum]KAJ5870843.1 hypothetical protein N7455_005784 [Penicillium solitum]